MNNKSRLLVTLLLGLFLTACATTSDKGTEATTTTTTTTKTDTGPVVDPSLNDAFGTGLSLEQLKRLGIEGDPLNYKTIYFEYNSARIHKRAEVIVYAHARYLQSRSGLSVTLEGHADERGTRDYNLALGERRANGVAGLLKAGGVSNSINTISYGEERPVDSSHNEAAWAKNRRVVISY